MCVQEEGRLVMELGDNAFMETQRKNKNQAKQKEKGKVPPQVKIERESKCFFYKKKGHMRRIMSNFINGLRRKVIQSYLFFMNLIRSLQEKSVIA